MDIKAQTGLPRVSLLHLDHPKILFSFLSWASVRAERLNLRTNTAATVSFPKQSRDLCVQVYHGCPQRDQTYSGYFSTE